MRMICNSLLLFGLAGFATAQNHEIGLTLGRISGPTRSSPAGELRLDPGIALQANYGYRFLTRRSFALSAEVHFLANGRCNVRRRHISCRAGVLGSDLALGFPHQVRSRLAPVAIRHRRRRVCAL